MSTTSKSPRRVLLVALGGGASMALRDYAAHRFSPKKFTQPQLLACLVLKEFLSARLSQAGSACSATHPTWPRRSAWSATPHFTTFQKGRPKRLLRSSGAAGQLLAATLPLCPSHPGKLRGRIRLAALDGSGWESRHASGITTCAGGPKGANPS